MPKFTPESAAELGRRGGQRSHRRLEQEYAQLVIRDPAAAERVAQLIEQGHRLTIALRAVRLVDAMNREVG